MNLPLLSKLFKKRLPKKYDSKVLAKVASLAKRDGMILFTNTPVFYRSKQEFLSLSLFIPQCGLVLFAFKEWSYQELQGATVSKASHTQPSSNTLSFENISNFLQEKLSDLGGFDDMGIFNFAIMEKLSKKEYKRLDESFSQLLPASKILFADDTEEEIAKKLLLLPRNCIECEKHKVLPYLFGQYLIPGNNGTVYFANKEQRVFIDKTLQSTENLTGDRQSGKSTIVLQKALLSHLQNKEKKISILVATKLQAELLQQKLLQIIELSAVVIEMEQIKILNTVELFGSFSTIDKSKKKELVSCDMLIIDDTFSIPPQYLNLIKQMHKADVLILVNDYESKSTHHLTESYYGDIVFVKGNPFVILLQKIYSLLQNEPDAEILIVCKEQSAIEAILEDIQGYTGANGSRIEIDKNILFQNPSQLQIVTYDLKNPLCSDYLFLIDVCEAIPESLEHLAKSAKKECVILYEDLCVGVANLKQKVENGKDTKE